MMYLAHSHMVLTPTQSGFLNQGTVPAASSSQDSWQGSTNKDSRWGAGHYCDVAVALLPCIPWTVI